MSSSPDIILYTQIGCDFCDIMKNKLSDWGYLFQEVNISRMPEQKEFLRKEGHTSVPQIYVNGKHANKVDTINFTEEMLRESL